MQSEVLGNIPRLYTALADWLACLLYLFFLPKRTAGWRRYTIHAVFLLLLGVFMQATGQVPQFWFLPCIAVSILIMYLYIRMQADVPARSAGYYCVRAFILGELAASLEWQLYYYMAGRQGTPGAGVSVCILAVDYAAVYGAVFALERNYNDIASPLHVHKKEFLSTLFIGVAVYAASNLSYVSPDTPFSGKMTAEIYNIRTLVDLGGMAILFAHHMQLVEYRRKKERDALQNVLQAQYAQYRSAQDSIDLINKKYHDLKHQIAVLRSETSEEKAHYLDAMEQEIRSYEAQNKTGNEVLDVVLTEKSMHCEARHITLNCVADGSAVAFVEPGDLYALFSNALDQAIDAVNEIASEHLEILTKNPYETMTKVKNAGAIFLGEYSSEPLGDYFAGPNHILPTNGTARFFSPLNVDDFLKKTSIISYSRDALEKVHKEIELFAEKEGLTAHANSIKVRFE